MTLHERVVGVRELARKRDCEEALVLATKAQCFANGGLTDHAEESLEAAHLALEAWGIPVVYAVAR